MKAGFATSNGDARRTIQGGGVRVNETQVKDIYAQLDKAELAKNETVLQKGKKNFKKIIVE